MIPSKMNQLLRDALPQSVIEKRVVKDGPLRFLEFGPSDVDSLQRLGIAVDRLGP